MTAKVLEAFEALIADRIVSFVGVDSALEKDANGEYKTTWVRTAWNWFQFGLKEGRESMREEAVAACCSEAESMELFKNQQGAFSAESIEKAIMDLP